MIINMPSQFISIRFYKTDDKNNPLQKNIVFLHLKESLTEKNKEESLAWDFFKANKIFPDPIKDYISQAKIGFLMFTHPESIIRLVKAILESNLESNEVTASHEIQQLKDFQKYLDFQNKGKEKETVEDEKKEIKYKKNISVALSANFEEDKAEAKSEIEKTDHYLAAVQSIYNGNIRLLCVLLGVEYGNLQKLHGNVEEKLKTLFLDKLYSLEKEIKIATLEAIVKAIEKKEYKDLNSAFKEILSTAYLIAKEDVFHNLMFYFIEYKGSYYTKNKKVYYTNNILEFEAWCSDIIDSNAELCLQRIQRDILEESDKDVVLIQLNQLKELEEADIEARNPHKLAHHMALEKEHGQIEDRRKKHARLVGQVLDDQYKEYLPAIYKQKSSAELRKILEDENIIISANTKISLSANEPKKSLLYHAFSCKRALAIKILLQCQAKVDLEEIEEENEQNSAKISNRTIYKDIIQEINQQPAIDPSNLSSDFQKEADEHIKKYAQKLGHRKNNFILNLMHGGDTSIEKREEEIEIYKKKLREASFLYVDDPLLKEIKNKRYETGVTGRSALHEPLKQKVEKHAKVAEYGLDNEKLNNRLIGDAHLKKQMDDLNLILNNKDKVIFDLQIKLKISEEKNKRLTQENADFKQENTQLKEERIYLKEKNKSLKQKNTSYKQENVYLQQKNTEWETRFNSMEKFLKKMGYTGEAEEKEGEKNRKNKEKDDNNDTYKSKMY